MALPRKNWMSLLPFFASGTYNSCGENVACPQRNILTPENEILVFLDEKVGSDPCFVLDVDTMMKDT